MLLMCSATEKCLPKLRKNSFLPTLGGNLLPSSMTITTSWPLPILEKKKKKKRHRQGCWTWQVMSAT